MGIAETTAELDAMLPQTQCRQCGYSGCRAYARAMALGQADINRCPPGGRAVAARLATRLALPIRPIDPSCGQVRPYSLARIDEPRCIGCVACIRVCPVDAILGARKRTHTVIESECTGCELCVPACPVDCIHLVPMPVPGPDRRDGAADFDVFLNAWMRERAPKARMRFERRAARSSRAPSGRRGRETDASLGADRAAVVAAAVSRVRERRRAAAVPETWKAGPAKT